MRLTVKHLSPCVGGSLGHAPSQQYRRTGDGVLLHGTQGRCSPGLQLRNSFRMQQKLACSLRRLRTTQRLPLRPLRVLRML